MPSLMPNLLAVSDLRLAMPIGQFEATAGGDWDTLHRVDNLLQAVWLRLNTAEGALAALGHPEYGSRLYLLIGQLDTPETRERARLYVLRALTREPRVDRILAIHITGRPAGGGRQLDVSVRLLPVDDERPLDFGFPIFLEPAA